MTTLNLIAKSVENLRNIQLKESLSMDHDDKKKEKIANCMALTDAISLSTVKANPQVLNLAIETLLCLCDDFDADVRTVADECLNRIIRVTADSYVLKIQVELFREIKRNGAARCLKAALWRFGLLSHMIRPSKVKIFAPQLIAAILQTVKRKEEIVIETLGQSLGLILQNLGQHLSDKDIKALIEACFQNISSKESIVRRTSANMILMSCLNSRRPNHFLNHVLEQLLDMLSQVSLVDLEKEENKNCTTILGVFTCLKSVIPHIGAKTNFEQNMMSDNQVLDYYICIYEACLFYVKCYTNHNIINAALETLLQLLQNLSQNVAVTLLSKDGLSWHSNKLKDRARQWPSKSSLSTTVFSETNMGSTSNIFEASIDIPEISSNVKNWISDISDEGSISTEGSSKISLTDSFHSTDDRQKGVENYSELVIGNLDSSMDIDLESNASSDFSKLEKPTELSFEHQYQNQIDSESDVEALPTYPLDNTACFKALEYLNQRGELFIGNENDTEPALHYCCRLIASSFLLTGTPGELMPDDIFRVSVKSLALNCLACIFRLVPELLVYKLEINGEQDQIIFDCLKFVEHTDPQIRGNIAVVTGCFLRGVLDNSSSFIEENEKINLQSLIQLFVKCLLDESATTCRHALGVLSVFLPTLLESDKNQFAIPILKILPKVSNNPYFLVKIKLSEVICELPYASIEYSCSELNFQQNVVDILFNLVKDTDQRVRKAASNAFIKIIPHICYNRSREDAVAKKVIQHTEVYLVSGLMPFNSYNNIVEHRLLIESLPLPYSALFYPTFQQEYQYESEETLSRILVLLFEYLLSYPSKYSYFGCCETLSALSEKFLTTVYDKAWDCQIISKEGKNDEMKNITGQKELHDSVRGFSNPLLSSLSVSLFSQTLIFLTSSPFGMDLLAHRNTLILSGNLVSGIASSCLVHNVPKDKSKCDVKYWAFFRDKDTSHNVEKLLQHILKMLNIFQHVLEDLPSPLSTLSKSSLTSISHTTPFSPKQKSRDKPRSSEKAHEAQNRPIFRFGKDQLGSISGQTHYLRLYEILCSAHFNYCITLDQSASELYLSLLKACLKVLAQILEVATVFESSRIAEELLHYLESTVTLLSTDTLQCVRQLLKSLFGANLGARYYELSDFKNNLMQRDSQETREQSGSEDGFYKHLFEKPSKIIAETIKDVSSTGVGCNELEMNLRQVAISSKREEKKTPTFFKILNRNPEQKSLGSFIRLFEPLVIKSLRQYTISNCSSLQCEVLGILSQLVQLHVNYCLVDPDQVFTGFMMKQFEYIEEGHINHTERLLPKIFDFLIRLSYEKYHSKAIIGLPKIIQLCDGLLASGQPASTHCIPALTPVVEELFFTRNPPANVSEEKELETTREVLVSMMLRQAEFPQILELLAKCLVDCRISTDSNGEEKWRRWSRQTMDTVLPLLIAKKVQLEIYNAHFALIKLFSAVSPTVFRPVDPLLKVLFAIPSCVEDNDETHHRSTAEITDFIRCLATVNAILLALMSYSKEEAMLARLGDFASFIPELPFLLKSEEENTSNASGDPLNVSGKTEPEPKVVPERILARFIFKAVRISTYVLSSAIQDNFLKFSKSFGESSQQEKYLINQFSLLLQLSIHIFETGNHCKVAYASMQLIQGKDVVNNESINVDNLNKAIINIGKYYPTISCQWFFILTLLEYDNMTFWDRIIGLSVQSREKTAFNEIIQGRTAFILFSDYLCQNINDCKKLNWFLENYMQAAIEESDVAPVRELVTVALHRDPQASGSFLQSLEIENFITKPNHIKKLLKSLEAAHQSQSGKVIKIIILELLPRSKYLVLSRMAMKLACRRIELLLTLDRDEAVEQISRTELEEMMKALKKQGVSRNFGSLIGLLNKLAIKYYNMKPLEINSSKLFNPAEIKSTVLDRAWFISQVQSRCCDSDLSYGNCESAWLLSNLSLEECLSILAREEFNKRLLKECVIVGSRLTYQSIKKMELDGADRYREPSENSLHIAAKQNIMLRLRNILKNLPASEIFNLFTNEINLYSKQLKHLLGKSEFIEVFFSIIPATKTLVNHSQRFAKPLDEECKELLARFAILCLEVVHFLVYDHKTYGTGKLFHDIDDCLDCAKTILKNPSIGCFLGSSKYYTLVCSAANALNTVVGYSCKFYSDTEPPALEVDNHALKEAIEDQETKEYAVACLRMARLVSWLEVKQKSSSTRLNRDGIPEFLMESVTSLIVSISRQPLVNPFVIMPPKLWGQGINVIGTGPTKCHFTFFLSEPNDIPDIPILEDFMYRLSLLGWISRQQFEEIWMVLLGVLNICQLQNHRVEHVEIAAGCTASLAVQAITNLLMQTLLLPHPGSPHTSEPIQHSRDPMLSVQKESTRKLYHVQELLLWEFENRTTASGSISKSNLKHLFNRGNLEFRPRTRQSDEYGKLSILYHWAQSCGLLYPSAQRLIKLREEALSSLTIDVDSCLCFLLELYTSWMSTSTQVPNKLSQEVVKSLLFISELFVERPHFQRMLDACLDLWKDQIVDDEVLKRYLVVVICKASAVLSPSDTETLEKVKRIMENCLKSGSLSMRIATLHGILYLIQSATLQYMDFEGIKNVVQPLATEFVHRFLHAQDNSRVLNQSEEYQCLMWTLVFFLLEHSENRPLDIEVSAALTLIMSTLSSSSTSTSLHQMLLQGLERLVITKSVAGKILEHIVKIAINRLRQCNPILSLPALQLLLTCMYTESSESFNLLEDDKKDIQSLDFEPDILVRSIERSSAIFDKIKKAHPMEVEILCSVLSQILIDFFPPMEILTKVIGEFLSPQQPHPRLMAGLVFKVCEKACCSAQSELLQTWVVFSIQNFIQSLPLIMSTWCLSCFFISSSKNPWLKAIFPHVQSRIGKYEYEDKKILCLAASDFYSQLTNDAQKEAFIKTFEEAAKNPGTPFGDILESL